MRFCALGSGSEGNAWLLESKSSDGRPTRIMIDCGFTLKETVARLALRGLSPADLQGVLVTHEHDDHVGGVFKLARKFGVQIYSTMGTFRASVQAGLVDQKWLDEDKVRVFNPERAWTIGDLHIQPFTVPHDAAEPAQFTVTDGVHRFGIMTDCGRSTPHIIKHLSGCDALVLESNHDGEMLSRSEYPGSLKKRISGDYGHLSNDAAHEILAAVEKASLRYLVAAHLSKNTNHPDRVLNSWSQTLNGYSGEFRFADQANGLDWQTL
ncbi:MAG: MBL fold metallo-hydrolase [Burkholderiales bacterium]|nr:MBL fold metallo-hydrolase [Burkholderiales bacterium]